MENQKYFIDTLKDICKIDALEEELFLKYFKPLPLKKGIISCNLQE